MSHRTFQPERTDDRSNFAEHHLRLLDFSRSSLHSRRAISFTEKRSTTEDLRRDSFSRKIPLGLLEFCDARRNYGIETYDILHFVGVFILQLRKLCLIITAFELF